MFLVTEPDPFAVLAATRRVLETAWFVTINKDAVPRAASVVAAQCESRTISPSRVWPNVATTLADCIQYIFFQDAVNFCFWTEVDKKPWRVQWPQGNFVGGWYGLDACFQRGIHSGIPILNARYLAEMPRRDAQKMFAGVDRVPIPLEGERWENLREAGKVLLTRFDGHFRNVLEETHYDAVLLVHLLRLHFPSFCDEAVLDGMTIPFLKRAQICAYDLSLLSAYFPFFGIINTEQLTAFADYKIPQILRAFGVIEYQEEFAEKIDNFCIVIPGSREEIEIRSATVWGVELIRQHIQYCTAAQIDNALWKFSQDRGESIPPYHRTRTIFY